MSGFASMNGYEDRPPVLPPLAMADMIAGQSGACAVMMALRARDRDGTGQVIDLSLFEPMFSTLGPQMANLKLSQREPRRMGSLSELSAPRNIYETKDHRYVALSASTQAMAERVFTVIGKPDLIDDPRFRTNTDRINHLEACDRYVAEFMLQHNRDDLIALFTQAEVTVGIVASFEDLQDNEFIQSREVIVDVPDEEPLASFPMHAVSPRLSRTPGQINHAGPPLGRDSQDIMQELGYTTDNIEQMVQNNTVQRSEPTE
jgi:formyl-CoA transferase